MKAFYCELCPRRCASLRDERRGAGWCRMPAVPVLARAALHHWEEPPISGTRGSGAVFFSGCSLRCVFCQNERISQRRFGKAVTVQRLREICLELIAQGAHNINLVNPSHYAHVALALFQEGTLPVPLVWNSGGYDRVETLRSLEGFVDIYLPDMKYFSSAPAERYSGAAGYPEAARAAIREMVRQTGQYVLDCDGLLKRGVIIRHLVLPGLLAEAKAVMDWVRREFGTRTVLFSLMSQYSPYARAAGDPQLRRTLRRGEVRAAVEYMQNLGLPGYFQDRSSARDDYIPTFDLTGL